MLFFSGNFACILNEWSLHCQDPWITKALFWPCTQCIMITRWWLFWNIVGPHLSLFSVELDDNREIFLLLVFINLLCTESLWRIPHDVKKELCPNLSENFDVINLMINQILQHISIYRLLFCTWKHFKK